jgi:hypothetical protein
MHTLHLSCIHLLRWSLKRSVKRTWTSSAFSTNESALSDMVTGSQSRVWSGPNQWLRASQAMMSQRQRLWATVAGPGQLAGTGWVGVASRPGPDTANGTHGGLWRGIWHRPLSNTFLSVYFKGIVLYFWNKFQGFMSEECQYEKVKFKRVEK